MRAPGSDTWDLGIFYGRGGGGMALARGGGLPPGKFGPKKSVDTLLRCHLISLIKDNSGVPAYQAPRVNSFLRCKYSKSVSGQVDPSCGSHRPQIEPISRDILQEKSMMNLNEAQFLTYRTSVKIPFQICNLWRHMMTHLRRILHGLSNCVHQA